MPTSQATSSARALLALVEPFGPAVEGGDLTFAADLPADLDAVVSILHTGVRALLTGRQWWGSSVAGATELRVVTLNPDAPIPPWCWLLCAAGDSRWDRVQPWARLDHPGLFAPR